MGENQHHSGAPRPLFILAPPRSFTSVVCGMIGQHPEMYALPEVNLFVADRYRGLKVLYRRFRPHLAHGLLRAVAELGLGAQTADDVEAARTWLEEDPSLSTTTLFEDLITWAAPRRIVDKSPLHVLKTEHLTRIGNAVPNAQFLHLTRHPRATCASVKRLNEEIETLETKRNRGQSRRDQSWRFVETDALDPDQLWLLPHLRIVEFLEQIPSARKLRVRGEDLMAEPGRGLLDIVRWLGVSESTDALEAMLHPERSPFACFGPRNALLGGDPGFLRNPTLRPFEPPNIDLADETDFKFGDDLKALAEEFGYR